LTLRPYLIHRSSLLKKNWLFNFTKNNNQNHT
jgi:hypothetical protein